MKRETLRERKKGRKKEKETEIEIEGVIKRDEEKWREVDIDKDGGR